MDTQECLRWCFIVSLNKCCVVLRYRRVTGYHRVSGLYLMLSILHPVMLCGGCVSDWEPNQLSGGENAGNSSGVNGNEAIRIKPTVTGDPDQGHVRFIWILKQCTPHNLLKHWSICYTLATDNKIKLLFTLHHVLFNYLPTRKIHIDWMLWTDILAQLFKA